ncbi:unnamed protein product [Brassica rapa subsp. narinosa]|nr:unnamed protein product [Brassica napus]
MKLHVWVNVDCFFDQSTVKVYTVQVSNTFWLWSCLTNLKEAKNTLFPPPLDSINEKNNAKTKNFSAHRRDRQHITVKKTESETRLRRIKKRMKNEGEETRLWCRHAP